MRKSAGTTTAVTSSYLRKEEERKEERKKESHACISYCYFVSVNRTPHTAQRTPHTAHSYYRITAYFRMWTMKALFSSRSFQKRTSNSCAIHVRCRENAGKVQGRCREISHHGV